MSANNFVLSNRNIIIPSPDGKTSVRLNRGQIGPVPAWAAKTAYFKALVADGKLVVSDSRRDKDEDRACEEAEKARMAAEEAARKAAEEDGQKEGAEEGQPPDGE